MEAEPALDPDLLRQVEASCVCLLVQRASRAVGRHFDNSFRQLDLNNWQFSLLAAIGGGGAQSVNELATFLGMDSTTMTRNLSVLQRRGLLAKVADTQDGRIKRSTLTPQGQDLLLAALAHWRLANDAMEARVPAATIPAVRRALERMAQP